VHALTQIDSREAGVPRVRSGKADQTKSRVILSNNAKLFPHPVTLQAYNQMTKSF